MSDLCIAAVPHQELSVPVSVCGMVDKELTLVDVKAALTAHTKKMEGKLDTQ